MTTPTLSMRRSTALVALVAALAVPAMASAAGYSADVEFIRPTFGYGSFQGTAVPMAKESLAFRYGAVVQYEMNPVTLFNALSQAEEGAVVTNRTNINLGVSFDLSERVTIGALVPTAFNFGSEVAPFAADGFGMSDIGLGAQGILIKMPSEVFNLGLRAGLILPTGRADSYMSEAGIRTTEGLLAMVQAGPLRVATDVGVMTRKEVLTDEDFNLSHELQWNNGVRVALPAATRTAFTAQLMSRNVLAEAFKGGAENALEALGGVQVLPVENVVVDVGAGRGLTEGYGTTDLRILAAVTIQRVPPPPKPEPVIVDVPPPPPPPPPVVDEPEVEPVFEGETLAILTLDEIRIKDQLEFVVDTNVLKDYSRPTLQAVADIINGDASLGHIAIEGHASKEGTHEHNYTLAESRARRIWEELITLGVHPDRISYRGMGEVVTLPGFEGEDEESLQKNRRVLFKIVHHYKDIADMPDYPATVVLPWNGTVVPVIQPKKPEVPQETKPEEEKDEFDQFDMDKGNEGDQ